MTDSKQEKSFSHGNALNFGSYHPDDYYKIMRYIMYISLYMHNLHGQNFKNNDRKINLI